MPANCLMGSRHRHTVNTDGGGAMQATDRSKSSHLGYDNLAIYRMVVLLAIGTLFLSGGCGKSNKESSPAPQSGAATPAATATPSSPEPVGGQPKQPRLPATPTRKGRPVGLQIKPLAPPTWTSMATTTRLGPLRHQMAASNGLT